MVKAATLNDGDDGLICDATSGHDGADGLWIEALSRSMTVSKGVSEEKVIRVPV